VDRTAAQRRRRRTDAVRLGVPAHRPGRRDARRRRLRGGRHRAAPGPGARGSHAAGRTAPGQHPRGGPHRGRAGRGGGPGVRRPGGRGGAGVGAARRGPGPGRADGPGRGPPRGLRHGPGPGGGGDLPARRGAADPLRDALRHGAGRPASPADPAARRERAVAGAGPNSGPAAAGRRGVLAARRAADRARGGARPGLVLPDGGLGAVRRGRPRGGQRTGQPGRGLRGQRAPLHPGEHPGLPGPAQPGAQPGAPAVGGGGRPHLPAGGLRRLVVRRHPAVLGPGGPGGGRGDRPPRRSGRDHHGPAADGARHARGDGRPAPCSAPASWVRTGSRPGRWPASPGAPAPPAGPSAGSSPTGASTTWSRPRSSSRANWSPTRCATPSARSACG
jgi:hypothetical protein